MTDQFNAVADPAVVGYAIVVETSFSPEDNFWLLNHIDPVDLLNIAHFFYKSIIFL